MLGASYAHYHQTQDYQLHAKMHQKDGQQVFTAQVDAQGPPVYYQGPEGGKTAFRASSTGNGDNLARIRQEQIMRMQLQNHRSNPSSAISGMPYNVNGVQHQLTEHQVYSMNAAMAQERKNLFQELHQLNHKVDQERDRGQYEFSSPQ